MPCCTASAACFCECQCPVSAGSKSFSRKCFPVSTRNLSDNFLVFMLDQPPGQTGLPPLYFDGLRAHDRQLCLLPGIEAASHIDHILESGALQQAGGNHAAISAFAVHCHLRVAVHFGWGDFEIIQRPPCRVLDMTSLPFRRTANIEHLQVVGSKPDVKLLHVDLPDSSDWKPSLPPCLDAATKKSVQGFDPDPRQPDSCLFQLLVRPSNQHRMCRQSQHSSCPRCELPRQRNVHRPRHVTCCKLLARSDIQRDLAVVQHRLQIRWLKGPQRR